MQPSAYLRMHPCMIHFLKLPLPSPPRASPSPPPGTPLRAPVALLVCPIPVCLCLVCGLICLPGRRGLDVISIFRPLRRLARGVLLPFTLPDNPIRGTLGGYGPSQ